jgi:squalene synthase HpnC
MRTDNNRAYDLALTFARTHYENFPVVSFLIPKELRKHVAIIYWFARTADDIADEGTLPEEERLKRLNDFEEIFNNLRKGTCNTDYEYALYQTIKEKELNPEHFLALLKAFKQDVLKKRYNNYDELLDYCRNSANPVGRLILELHNIRDEEANIWSDKICTALQIANFLQDVGPDYEKGRIYLPEDELYRAGISKKMFEEREINLNFKRLIEFNVDRTQKLFDEGKNLIKFLHGRLKLEIKWTILGGEAILGKIRNNNYNVFIRPSLSKTDFIRLFIKSFI